MHLTYLPSISFCVGAVAKTEASARRSGATVALDLGFWSFLLPTFWDPFFCGKTLLISRCLVAMLGAETHLTSLVVCLKSTDDQHFDGESDGEITCRECRSSEETATGKCEFVSFVFVALARHLQLSFATEDSAFFSWSTPRLGIQLYTTYSNYSLLTNSWYTGNVCL